MPYSTLTDIEALIREATLTQLTDDVNAGAIDTDKVDAAISTADAIIDGFLRGRYTLPLSTVPLSVARLSRDLAIYELYSRRIEGGVPEGIQKRADDAQKRLIAIQKGDFVLDVVTPDAQVGGFVQINKDDTDRLFGPETLARF